MVPDEVQEVANLLDAHLVQGAVDLGRLFRELAAGAWELIWIASHGSDDGIELTGGMASGDILAAALRGTSARLIVLYTCSSETAAQQLYSAAGVPILCNVGPVPDTAAYATARRFAQELADGRDVAGAFAMAKTPTFRLIPEGLAMYNRQEDEISRLARRVDRELGFQAVTEGASKAVCEALGIPPEWADRCEDSTHAGHDGSYDALRARLEWILETQRIKNFADKIGQLGSYGGGNHFGECEITRVADRPSARDTADVFGLRDGHVSFLSHCGSRGFGNLLATHQFKDLERKFETWSTPYPAGDKKLVYAPLGTPEANAYLDDMALGSNFATVNHLLINALVLEAFQEVLPGTQGRLVYFISHNIAREEIVNGNKAWVHRKGATRAVPGGHFSLHGTPFAETGHPILLPGNPRDGSVVMVARGGAERTAWSVNHGAGRQMGRKHAARTLDQAAVDAEFDTSDILTNCRKYPLDEAPDAYKNFPEVLRSVEAAGLAETVAKLQARFVIKDSAEADD